MSVCFARRSVSIIFRKMNSPREEFIEADICDFLMFQKVFCWKNDIKGYYDQKSKTYRKNKSNFILPGISDIGGLIPWTGRAFAIEVKRPEEMKFFDRPLEELKQEFIEATRRNIKASTIKRYQHAVEQATYIERVIQEGGVAFYASSIQDVKDWFSQFGYTFDA